MAVLIETSMGDLVIDLFVKEAPMTCLNFLKLCKVKYYNHCLFHNIQKDFLVQTGDPTNTGKGGQSVFSMLEDDNNNKSKYFMDEIVPTLKHKEVGTVAMASAGKNLNGSQFYITTASNLTQLDEKHTIFGQVAEGLEVLQKINDIYTDGNGKPLQVVRVKHTIILDDPFDDPKGLMIPNASPLPPRDKWADLLDDDEMENLGKMDDKSLEELQEQQEIKEAKSRAEVLEIIGDIPDRDVAPPDNVLFICKLNAATQSEDLELIFSRFGEVTRAEVIRDWKTGDSLQYAFIEFVDHKACEEAYRKMEGVSIDDRRIHVDYSQSVSRQVIGKDGKMTRVLNTGTGNVLADDNNKHRSHSGSKFELKEKHSYGKSSKHYDLVDDYSHHTSYKSSSRHDDKHRHKDKHQEREARRDRERESDRNRDRDRHRDRDRSSRR